MSDKVFLHLISDIKAAWEYLHTFSFPGVSCETRGISKVYTHLNDRGRQRFKLLRSRY